jgi:hypothetical protein
MSLPSRRAFATAGADTDKISAIFSPWITINWFGKILCALTSRILPAQMVTVVACCAGVCAVTRSAARRRTRKKDM